MLPGKHDIQSESRGPGLLVQEPCARHAVNGQLVTQLKPAALELKLLRLWTK